VSEIVLDGARETLDERLRCGLCHGPRQQIVGESQASGRQTVTAVEDEFDARPTAPPHKHIRFHGCEDFRALRQPTQMGHQSPALTARTLDLDNHRLSVPPNERPIVRIFEQG
jgi:hypothetical protein